MHQSEPTPRLSGREDELSKLMQGNRCIEPKDSDFDLNHVRSCFACALHMHQPTIPAGREGDLISHLQYMFEHSGEGDNHNAEPFAQCYRRFADLLPDLIGSGCYSCLRAFSGCSGLCCVSGSVVDRFHSLIVWTCPAGS